MNDYSMWSDHDLAKQQSTLRAQHASEGPRTHIVTELEDIFAEQRRRLAGAALQLRVAPWMMACFGLKIATDRLERGDRLLEEVLELLQSGGYPEARVAALVGYTYGRPAGDPHQETGGVMITLAAYCLAHGIDMHKAGEDELARISQPETMEKIRAKQAAKPTGSALPGKHTIVDRLEAKVDLLGIDLVALDKLSLISHALADKIGGSGGAEQRVLAGVLDALIRQLKLSAAVQK